MATLDYGRWGEKREKWEDLGPSRRDVRFIRLDTVAGTAVLVWKDGTTSTLSTVA
jgi:hypothetical protein